MLNFTQWLKEAHQHHLNKLGKYQHIDPKDLNMSSLFGDKRRIAISLDGTEDPIYQFQRLFKSLTNHPLTLDELKKGLVSQSVQTQHGPKERLQSISNFLKKHKRTDLLDLYSQAKERINNTDTNESYSIIISREPIDLLRMSDHVHANGKEIQSCHSPGNNWFHCAIKEAKTGGAIAYAVKTSDLNDVNLQDKEIFTDIDRKKAGIIPLERLRLRRFTNGQQEILIPELRTYPATNQKTFDRITVPGFKEAVTKWAKESQQAAIQTIQQNPNAFQEFQLRGGSYQDNDAGDLWSNFFNKNFQGAKSSIDQRDQEDKDQALMDADEWMQAADEFHHNHEQHWQNTDNIVVNYQAHNPDFEGHAYGTWNAQIDWFFEHTQFTQKPNKNIIDGLTDFLHKKGYRDIQRFSFNMTSYSHDSFDVAVSAKLNQHQHNDGSLNDFEEFLDKIDQLDQNYDEINQLITAFFTKQNVMTNDIINHHDNLKLLHFTVELNQGTGNHHYRITSNNIRIGNLLHYPSDARLLGSMGSGRLMLPWKIINELNLPVPTQGAIPDRQVFFLTDPAKNINSNLVQKLPLPSAVVDAKFTFEVSINDQHYIPIYQMIKHIDDQFLQIADDLRHWWQLLIPALQHYQSSLSKRNFDD
jgi:hypothetical protein